MKNNTIITLIVLFFASIFIILLDSYLSNEEYKQNLIDLNSEERTIESLREDMINEKEEAVL